MKAINTLLFCTSIVSLTHACEQVHTKKTPIMTQQNNASVPTKDVLTFIEQNLPPVGLAMADPYQSGITIYSIERVAEKLKQQDYSSVLEHVWAELDVKSKKDWLIQKATEGHPLLMIELGKLLAAQDSLEEGLTWLYVGLFRAQQDAYCCQCPTFEGDYIPSKFLKLYLEHFKSKTTGAKKSLVRAKKKALEMLKNWKNFPPPQWIAFCAPGLPANASVLLRPESEWAKRRAEVIAYWERKIGKSYVNPLYIGLGAAGIFIVGYLVKSYYFTGQAEYDIQ